MYFFCLSRKCVSLHSHQICVSTLQVCVTGEVLQQLFLFLGGGGGGQKKKPKAKMHWIRIKKTVFCIFIYYYYNYIYYFLDQGLYCVLRCLSFKNSTFQWVASLEVLFSFPRKHLNSNLQVRKQTWLKIVSQVAGCSFLLHLVTHPDQWF